jgi:hypothetical protein
MIIDPSKAVALVQIVLGSGIDTHQHLRLFPTI